MLGLILVVVLVILGLLVVPRLEYRADVPIHAASVGVILLLIVVAMLWAFGVI